MKPRVAALAGIAAVAAAWAASAQHVDPRRPASFVVGAPGGAAPMQRVDARRSGLAKDALPGGPLRIAWKKTTGLGIDQAALAGSDGTLAVVTTRGDVVFLDDAGDEKGHVTVGAGSVGPAAMTSDGTVVFATSSGDVVGVKRGAGNERPRFTRRIGGDRGGRAAPLALDDGGVVIASASELVVLDAEGNVRARAPMPEPIVAPVLAAAGQILAIGASGAVFGWTPGREPSRLGSFGAPIDGGAALADATTLTAVIEGNHLVDLDLVRGVRTTRAIAAQGLYLGPPSVRGVGRGASTTTLLAMTPSRGFVVTVDASGKEAVRAPIATFTPQTLPDGGAAPLIAPPHVGPLVDARGAIAFAATDGRVGVVTPEGAVETFGDALCSRSGRTIGSVAGLTPFGRGSFAVACVDGVVVRVVGPEAGPPRKSSTSTGEPLRPAPPGPAPEPAPTEAPEEPDEPDAP